MRAFIYLTALLIAVPVVAVSQSIVSSGATTAPNANAVRRTHPVRIDGRLDEPDWSTAPVIATFRQAQPHEGALATQRTEIRILFDDDAIYVGARMFDSLGERGVHARLARRDAFLDLDTPSPFTSDKLTITLDAYHDHLSQAVFQINPLGVLGDALGEGGSSIDDSWDPIWQGAARMDSTGWTAELRIPLSQLGYAVTGDHTWGMQIARVIDRLNERDVWSFWRANETGGPSRFGNLTGVDVPPHRRNVELLPYIVSRTRRAPIEAGNPFTSHTDETVRAGTDIKAQVTPSLTLNATINPDFGQVEVDPAVVNLSAFETFFPEKRPFFVHDANAFDFGGFDCFVCHNSSSLGAFYSRRIGRAPQLGDEVTGSALYADVPDASTIIGAAKLTGRVGENNTIGLLDAVTNAEHAQYIDSAGGPRLTQLVEPLTNYLVARGRRDFRGGATTAGVILTSVLRRTNDSLVANVLRSSATVVGADFNTTTTDRRYSLMGSLLVSDVSGTPAAILSTERSSAHYFQRPDRRERTDGLFSTRYDSGGTVLRGYGAYIRGAKESGDWLWETMLNVRSPGFEVNDMSYLDRADYLWSDSNLLRQWTTPGSWYRNASITIGTQQQYNYDGDHTMNEPHVYGDVQFRNYWFLNALVMHDGSMLDDQLTRGGPVVRSSGLNTFKVVFGSDPRKPIVFSNGLRYSTGTGAGRGTSRYILAPELDLKPASNVSVALAPSFSWGKTAEQFVTRIADPTATAFYGQRTVFSTIDQTTISLDTHASWAFTPRLTLETFIQPFFASGAYAHFSEFARPRSGRLTEYGKNNGSIISTQRDARGLVTQYSVDPDGPGPASVFVLQNPDFNTQSLRGNAVLRWEYRPGSTLYLVWTHERSGAGGVDQFDWSHDVRDLFRAQPTNTVQLKASYWLGR